MDDIIEISSSLLKQIAKALDSLTQEEKDALRRNEANLRLVIEPKVKRRAPAVTTEKPDLHLVRDQLISCRSREEAMQIIEHLEMSKTSLSALAKTLDLSVQKDDTVSRLIEKIVDNTVGFRLRSQAILGNSDSTIFLQVQPDSVDKPLQSE